MSLKQSSLSSFMVALAVFLTAAALAGAPVAAADSGATNLAADGGAMGVEARPADSPDGDPPFSRTVFPASAYPIDPPAGTRGGGVNFGSPDTGLGGLNAFSAGGRTTDGSRALTSEFVLAGELPEGDTPSGAAFTPDGSQFLIAHRDSMNVIVYDAATRAFVREISVSGSPADVAVSSDGVYAVTANMFEDTASIIDMATGAETHVITVGDQPGVARITPDGATALIGNTIDGTISVIDLATATELRRLTGAPFLGTLSVNFEPAAIAASFEPFGVAGNNAIVHADYYGNQVIIFDIAAGTSVTLSSSNYPRGVAVTPDGTKAVVSHASTVRTVSVIDVGTASISKTIATSVDLWGPITVKADGTKAVVGIQNACLVVNLITDAVSGSLNTASVYNLLTTSDDLYAIGVGYYGSLISYATESIVANLNNTVSTPVGAVSPTAQRAVLVANTFGEDMVVLNTNGSSGYMEGTGPSGPPPEGDKARKVALSPDGSTAVVVNIFSDNASIIDLATRTVLAIVDVGDRPAEAVITPDGTKAVVANLDSYFASVIDLTTYGVTNVSMGRRGGEVEISPDSQYAYIAVVADGDGVYRIDLNTLAVSGAKLLTGNMGSVSYPYNQTSGMTLSHDGTLLAVCGSFDDNVTIINTTGWSVLTTLGAGDFPVRALFNSVDNSLYITNRDDDTVTYLHNYGLGWVSVSTYSVGYWPYEMALNPAEDTLYVLNYQDKNVGVVDLGTGVMGSTITLPSNPAGLHLDASGTNLYVASGTWSVSLGPGPAIAISTEGYFSQIDTVSQTIVDGLTTGLPPAMLAYNATDTMGVMPSPFGDGITLVYEPVASTVTAALSCTPGAGTVPFSTTMTATMTNNYTGLTRRLAGRIDVVLAGGQSYSNWKSGWSNVDAGDSLVRAWSQSIPALGSVIGDNVFTLLAEDVTPSPYNQPPHPPSGDTDSGMCTVTGVAP